MLVKIKDKKGSTIEKPVEELEDVSKAMEIKEIEQVEIKTKKESKERRTWQWIRRDCKGQQGGGNQPGKGRPT